MTTDMAVATNTGVPGEVLPEHASGPRSFAWWGMALLIATEATLFALLIASYFYLRFRSGPVWPPDGIHKPDLPLVVAMSGILLSSSVPVHIADRAIRAGRQGLLRAGLLVGFVLGLVFMTLQVVVEYPTVLREFKPQTNAYGSLFFTITGFHGAHVVVGLVFSAWAQVRAWTGSFDAERHVTVQNFAMYWHFVDAVWLFVFAALYLSPHV